MLKARNERLNYFIANTPTTLDELNEVMLMSLERIGEVVNEFDGNVEAIPAELVQEIRLLDDIVARGLGSTEELLLSQLGKFCELLIGAVQEEELPRHQLMYGSLAASAGQTLH